MKTYYTNKRIGIKDLIGKIFSRVEVGENEETLTLYLIDGGKYTFFHDQDCCESVFIDEIHGDLSDLVGTPILFAEESISTDIGVGNGKVYSSIPDSSTWTFYKFATQKGWIDIRWYGESNGYYSEDVDLYYTAPGEYEN